MRERKVSIKRWLWIIAGILLLTLSIVVYFRYYFVYSEGTRVGTLYKFSKKGTFFKTYEGEMLLPGIKYDKATSSMNSSRFYFSVSDETLAQKLMNSQGMELELHYEYFKRSLPWRGDAYEGEKGQYMVDKLVRIKDENPNAYGF